jgi:hypothetical protein
MIQVKHQPITRPELPRSGAASLPGRIGNRKITEKHDKLTQ